MDKQSILATMSDGYRTFVRQWDRDASRMGLPHLIERLVNEAYVLGYLAADGDRPAISPVHPPDVDDRRDDDG